MPSRERALRAHPRPPPVTLSRGEAQQVALVGRRAVVVFGSRIVAAKEVGTGDNALAKVLALTTPYIYPASLIDGLAAWAGVSREALLAGRCKEPSADGLECAQLEFQLLTRDQRDFLRRERAPRWDLDPPQREEFTDARAYMLALGSYAHRCIMAKVASATPQPTTATGG